MPVTAVVGGHWGDEGKGKVINLLARDADLVIRGHGGANAGHTVVNEQGRFAVHLIPAGHLQSRARCASSGLAWRSIRACWWPSWTSSAPAKSTPAACASAPPRIWSCRTTRAWTGRRRRPRRAPPGHDRPRHRPDLRRQGRAASACASATCSTPTLFREKLQFVLRSQVPRAGRGRRRAAGRRARSPTSICSCAERLQPFIAETQPLVDEAVARGRQVLLEGAHATLLDLDHGTYPYVTSSHCTVAGLLQGSGVGPRRLTRAIGVYKAYCSRVGEGPFPTELFDETGDAHSRDRPRIRHHDRPPAAHAAGSTPWPGGTRRGSTPSTASP